MVEDSFILLSEAVKRSQVLFRRCRRESSWDDHLFYRASLLGWWAGEDDYMERS